MCPKTYYEKQSQRARIAFQWLGHYAQTGPQRKTNLRKGNICCSLNKFSNRKSVSKRGKKSTPDAPVPEQLKNMDVHKWTRTLRLLVHEMCGDYNRRTTIRPLDVGAVLVLTETLSDLVKEVCRYNRDTYEGSSQFRNGNPNVPERERNIYACLIGDPPSNPLFPLWMRDYFIINRLPAFLR